MALNISEVEHIAHLARIELTQTEKEMFTKQLSDVLAYINILNEVETSDVQPTTQVTGLENVYRDDQVVECNAEVVERIKQNFPQRHGDYLSVPRVLKK